MSGGAVYNASDDTLAGVIVGYSSRIDDNKSGKTLFKDGRYMCLMRGSGVAGGRGEVLG